MPARGHPLASGEAEVEVDRLEASALGGVVGVCRFVLSGKQRTRRRSARKVHGEYDVERHTQVRADKGEPDRGAIHDWAHPRETERVPELDRRDGVDRELGMADEVSPHAHE